MVLNQKNLKVQRHQQNPDAKMEMVLGERAVYCNFKASFSSGKFIMNK